MTKRMLIDATHAEETRVVVMDGNRLEDFDVETSTKKQLKGNIYLAKIVRVEPSLQAAFVEYGGGRHGFLAFGEIHPDYYQIPVADRERLLRLQAEEARAEEAAEEAEAGEAVPLAASGASPELLPEPHDAMPAPAASAASEDAHKVAADAAPSELPEPALPSEEGGSGEHGVPMPQAEEDATTLDQSPATVGEADGGQSGPEPHLPELPPEEQPPAQGGHIDTSLPDPTSALPPATALPEPAPSFADTTPADASLSDASFPNGHDPAPENRAPQDAAEENGHDHGAVETVAEEAPPPETVGGARADGEAEDGEAAGDDAGGEEMRERRLPARYLRNYKIQEVIRRRQIMLVQVVKEERGTKGAALTSYISLAGRFSVLMPNSPRGGGISRKITSAADRRRLKEVTAELAIPDGMGLIVRTAGANRPKPEIIRDCEYLLRLWDDIRETTLQSVAPALIHEEASLIKRAIRDNYSRDVDEVLVDGEDGWRQARDIMRMLMPAHARKVISWRDNPAASGQPLFAAQQVEEQLDRMMSPTVQLRSGGYLVINQTEALVAIDVNSGRSTRERGIEETALRTNLEAADEVARQLRLRDLAGLIVIDFIDMESKKHNGMVERRLKDALKVDRARIQVGQISHFGLMEMSRQRLRPSLAETSFVTCPHCGGLGHVRSTESSAIHVLRGIEEEGSRRRAAEIVVHVAPAIAMYVLNHKRDRLADIERRCAMHVVFETDATLVAPQMRIERTRAALPAEPVPVPIAPPPPALAAPAAPIEEEDEDDEDGETEMETGAAAAGSDGDGDPRRRRRRRRRRGRKDEAPIGAVAELDAEQPDLLPTAVAASQAAPVGGSAAAPGFPGEVPDRDAPEGGAHTGDVHKADMHKADMYRGDDTGADAPGGAAAETDAPPPAGEVLAADGEVPAADGEVSPAADGDRTRRRGRRGGRRRRRDAPAEGAEAGAGEANGHDVMEHAEPAYNGPTPANPFGGAPFDIYDVMEQAEQMPLPLAALAMPVPSVEAAETVPAPPHQPPTFEPAVAELGMAEPGMPEPGMAESGMAELEAPDHGDQVPAASEEMPALHAVESTLEPLVKPVLIDSGAPAPDRKRGWWRR